CVSEKVRSTSREPESARAERDSAAAFCRRESAERDDWVHRNPGAGKHSRELVQNASGKDQRADGARARVFSSARGSSGDGTGLSRLSKTDQLFSRNPAKDNDG